MQGLVLEAHDALVKRERKVSITSTVINLPVDEAVIREMVIWKCFDLVRYGTQQGRQTANRKLEKVPGEVGRSS